MIQLALKSGHIFTTAGDEEIMDRCDIMYKRKRVYGNEQITI